MLMQHKTTKSFENQDGFASLVIAIVIVLVLSLITVGFAQLMRTEQRSSLDKQLSSQAYYAAESGINDANKAIKEGYTKEKTQCGNTGSAVDSTAPGHENLSDNTVGSSSGSTTGASYPCLLINPNPKELKYDSVDTFTPTVTEFGAIDATGNPTQISKIEISWQDTDKNKGPLPSSSGVCNNGTFTPAGSGPGQWNYIGLLKFQLTPLTDLSRSGLISNTATTFLCPGSGNGSGGALSWSSLKGANAGAFITGNCSIPSSTAPYKCHSVIDGLDNPDLSNQTTFFLSMRSIYSKSSVNITAWQGTTQMRLTGAQTVIDSTGKAQDVLRRVQVRVPTYNSYDIAPGTSGFICKQVQTDPGGTDNNCQP